LFAGAFPRSHHHKEVKDRPIGATSFGAVKAVIAAASASIAKERAIKILKSADI
jgi:hypothetical protein